jgi:hypothetical protein
MRLTEIALVLMQEDAISGEKTGATQKKAVASRKGQTARAQRM